MARRANREIFEEVTGTVVDVMFSSMFNPWVVRVEYSYEGEVYARTEGIRFQARPLKAGPVRLGWQLVPKVNCIRVGDKVSVMLRADDPQVARICANREPDRAL